jgi:hypothetical protein
VRRGASKPTCRDTIPQVILHRHEAGDEEGAQKKDILEMYIDSLGGSIGVFIVVVVVIVVKEKGRPIVTSLF